MNTKLHFSKEEYLAIANKVIKGEAIDGDKLYYFLGDTEIIKTKSIIQHNSLTKEEIKQLYNAIDTYNSHDWEDVIFTTIDTVWDCFEDTTPSETVKKAFCEYLIAMNSIYEQCWDNEAATRANEYLNEKGVI